MGSKSLSGAALSLSKGGAVEARIGQFGPSTSLRSAQGG